MAVCTDSQKITTPETLDTSIIECYRRDGFVRVSQVINPDEVVRYYDATRAASEKLRDNHSSDIFTQTVNVWRDDPIVKELTLHPNVAGIAQKLAGVPLRIWHDHILIKQPHNKASTEFHQDQPYWPHTNSFHPISAWIALCDVPVERGCMSFIPGSFRRNDLQAQALNDPRSLFQICPELEYDPRITLPLKAGDCTFHHGRCAHMATPNFTDDPRVAHVIIYIDTTTTYSGKQHVVTNPLDIPVDGLLEGDLFPTVDSFMKSS